ncbi:MAG: hypothetical protein HKO56_07765, partial [Bacteroidia bacterium]|nr:hypothetical protein [Bacteroidia bacterium]
MKDSTSRISRVSRKLKLRLMLILVPFMFHSSVSGQLVISQYVETNSGSSPKGIEVWNASCSTIDFSTDTLEIFQATNGSSFFGQLTGATVTSGTLGPGEVLVIGTSDIGAYLTSVGLGAVTYVSYGFTFNGDDALEIRLGGVPQDRFGTLGVDPGAGWSGTCGATIATNNTNLELLPTVTSGDTSGFSDPCSRFTELNQGDSLLGFGVAPALPLCISPFPVNEFCEGSDLTLNYNSTQTTFTAGNVFNVELSNATGNFAAPLVIGSLADVSASGTINATIPLGQSPGTGYRIRIVSSNPATVGLVYESDITIGDAAEANAGPDISVCGGEEIGLGGTLMGSASSALWVGGTGQFPDGRNDPMGSYIPNQSEWGTTVTLQLVTNDPTGVCPADADTIDIEVLETPLLGAFGQVGNTCPTDSFDLTTLTVVDSNNTTGFLTYFDNTFNVLPSSWVTTTGIYYVFKTVPNPDTLKPDCFDFQPVTVIIQSCSCPAPTVTLDTAINVVCNGEATGAINVSVTGGSAPYIYAWSNGATTEDISGLVGDSTYTLTVYG